MPDHGVLSVLASAVYEGQFANGFEHGEGKKTYTDGSKFEGVVNYYDF
jgi:hypothetical protein